jgi:VWFA-related protein
MRPVFLRLFILCAAGLAFATHVGAQQQQPTPKQNDDVIRVSTELVQTDVMVFDKGGSFVDGLKPDQFELRIDGQPHPITFFERVAAGSRNEEAQLAAARGEQNRTGASKSPAVPLDRGRVVLFYLDDVHLSASSMYQARALLTRFIDHEMGQNDEVAIASASGQIGFLQQLTDDKTVLRAAVKRLSARPNSVHDGDRPPMSEYQALLIDRNDHDVIDFFIDELLKEIPNLPRQLAGDMVRARAAQMLQQASHFTTVSLSTLEGLVRSTSELPGRKLLFLVSDGFFLDDRNSDSLSRLRSITSAAARSGIVIYSIDARGLIASLTDASNPGAVDFSGRLQRASSGEIGASQDALFALARDTGGRALFNTNDLSAGVTTALKETSVYYLLAWRPENEAQRSGKFKHFQVNVIGRPELTVRLRRNFSDPEMTEKLARPKSQKNAQDAKQGAKSAGQDLRGALQALYPKTALPIFLAVNFLNLSTSGSVLAANMKIPAVSSMFEAGSGKPTANVDVAGALFDDHGKQVGGFQDRLTITANSELSPTDSLLYNYRTVVKPGLYQLRVAAHDQKSGRIGSAMRWIDVPDLAGRQIALSSILVGEHLVDSDSGQGSSPAGNSAGNKTADPLQSVKVNVDHHFARTSRLRFLVFAYNATTSGLQSAGDAAAVSQSGANTPPDVAIQVQVLRDNEPVITSPLRKIGTEGITDLARLPYAAEIPLQDLPAGRYLLKVTVIDRIAKKSASQQLGFEID